MCLLEATIWSIPCASKGEPVGDIEGLKAFERNPAWKARGRTPLLQMAAHGGDEGRRRPAKVRLATLLPQGLPYPPAQAASAARGRTDPHGGSGP